MKLYKYYSWSNYWNSGIGTSGMMMQVHEPIEQAVHDDNNIVDESPDEDPNLRSANRVTGYSINATDGILGEVEDFIIDDSFWKLDFIVVNTGKWFSDKKVLISSKSIKEIKWDASTIVINASVEQVKDSPEYN